MLFSALQVLKYLPSDKAQDARNYVQSLQYWLGGNSDNLENFILNLAEAYVPAFKGVKFDVKEPELYPDVGIWHPCATGQFLSFSPGLLLGLLWVAGSGAFDLGAETSLAWVLAKAMEFTL